MLFRSENAVYACDGHFGSILKAYREYLQSGDRGWLKAVWPRIELSLEYAIDRWDDDRDGILTGAQWNTYDCVIFGHSSFTTSLYLAALRAVEQMAITVDDSKQAASARKLFEKGSANLDAELFNGEFYIQTVDHDRYQNMQYGDGCHADQLLGQWWAHALSTATQSLLWCTARASSRFASATLQLSTCGVAGKTRAPSAGLRTRRAGTSRLFCSLRASVRGAPAVPGVATGDVVAPAVAANP